MNPKFILILVLIWEGSPFLPAAAQNNKFNIDPEILAKQVTIYRDSYGVPHIHGETDAATMFGFMYAQAEDGFSALERNVASKIGRLSEIEGQDAFEFDLYVRALETERLSREEYNSAPKSFKNLADAWAAGLNFFLEQHPDTPRKIQRYEPWQFFAMGRGESFWAPFAHGVLDHSEITKAISIQEFGKGSNFWMISGKKTVSGNAMLFINPHSEPNAYGEGHLISDEGLNLYGGYRFGFPLPVFGHTPHHGWGFTNNEPDVSDLWRETFDHPENPLAYRYGNDYRTAEKWTERIFILSETDKVERNVTFRKTHHGPIVTTRDGFPMALRIARYEEGGVIQQLYAMARAESFEEFKEAVSRLRYNWLNLGYADREGNIWFVGNGAVPKRSEKFDWSNPLDGSDPETEWKGYHKLEDLPQVLNPESGWLMNTNHSPFRVTSEDENPDPADYPEYMARSPYSSSPVLIDMKGDNPRARASRLLLESQNEYSFKQWSEATMSNTAFEAEKDITLLVEAWSKIEHKDQQKYLNLTPIIDTLRNWDYQSHPESVAMTIYMSKKMMRIWNWLASLKKPPVRIPDKVNAEPVPWDQWDPVAELEQVIFLLELDWGTWKVPYGEINRLQNPVNGQFSDDRKSFPVLGGPGFLGMIQTYIALPFEGLKQWYGVAGNSYVSVVEFGPEVNALTINGSGQSNNPNSPHYNDQAELYGQGKYKKAWTNLEDVKKNAVRVYRPGE